MARPKKSITQKQAQGTYHKSREPISLNLQPLTELPEPPDDFTDYEKEFYNRIAGALFDSGTLRIVDVMQVEMNAMWWHVYRTNRAEVCNRSVQTTDNGWKQISGSLTAVEKACKQLQSFSDRYGLNLISKDKISAPPPKDMKADKLKKMSQ